MLDYTKTPAKLYYSYDKNGVIVEKYTKKPILLEGGGIYTPYCDEDYYDRATGTNRKLVLKKGELALLGGKRYVLDGTNIKEVEIPSTVYDINGKERTASALDLPHIVSTNDTTTPYYDKNFKKIGTTSGTTYYFFDYLITDGHQYVKDKNCFKFVPTQEDFDNGIHGVYGANICYAEVVVREALSFMDMTVPGAKLNHKIFDVFKHAGKDPDSFAKTAVNFGLGDGKKFPLNDDTLAVYGPLYREKLIEYLARYANNIIALSGTFTNAYHSPSKLTVNTNLVNSEKLEIQHDASQSEQHTKS